MIKEGLVENSEINVELDIKLSSISIKILAITVLALKVKKYLSKYDFPSTKEFQLPIWMIGLMLINQIAVFTFH